MLPASGAEGLKVAVVPESVTVPGTLVDPCFKRKVPVVTVDGSTASLNVAATDAERETPVAPFTGLVEATVGGVVSDAGPVENDQT